MARLRIPTIQPNWIDRAVIYFRPVAGAQRMRARTLLALSGGYDGGRRDRRATSEWKTTAGSADADLLPDLPSLRERSRDLYRNAPLARGAVSTTTTNVVGTGLRLKARVDRQYLGLTDDVADRWERDAERIYDHWSKTKTCDIRRIQDIAALQELMFRSALIGGDVFCIKRFKERPGVSLLGFGWQVIEGDRVCNPNFQADGATLDNGNRLCGGVESDADGQPVAYHVLDRHPGDLHQVGRKWSRVPAFGPSGQRIVLHLARLDRPEQTRGEPYLAPVIESLKQIDRYRDAELMAAVVSAMFTVFIKSEGGAGELDLSDTAGETGAVGSDKDMKLAAGAILGLGPGESIETANPGRPNEAFDPFTQAILRQIGVALELPFEILVKHFTASYSAARAALLEAWRFFRVRRAWLAAEFCQPSYANVIAEAVARGLLDAPGFADASLIRDAYLGSEWIGQAPGQLDPLKEVAAAEKRLELTLTTRDAETAELTGRDWEQVVKQAGKERRIMEREGVAPDPAVSGPGGAPPASDDPDLPEQPEQA